MVEGTGAACAAALGFGAAVVSTRRGLRHLSAELGSAVSIPTTAALLWLLAPLGFDAGALHSRALWVFAAVGMFYPVLVTVLMFKSIAVLGPSVAATVGSTAPLFSVGAAALLLGEPIDGTLLIGLAAVVGGVWVLAWGVPGKMRNRPRAALLLPLAAAAVRATAEYLSKVGLELFSSPYMAALIGYTVSAVTIGFMTLSMQRAPRPDRRRGVPWFMLAAVLNGGAVLAVYSALTEGRLSAVAPIIASAPLFTLLFQRLLLRSEPVTLRQLAGALLVVAGMVLVVAGKAAASGTS